MKRTSFLCQIDNKLGRFYTSKSTFAASLNLLFRMITPDQKLELNALSYYAKVWNMHWYSKLVRFDTGKSTFGAFLNVSAITKPEMFARVKRISILW